MTILSYLSAWSLLHNKHLKNINSEEWAMAWNNGNERESATVPNEDT